MSEGFRPAALLWHTASSGPGHFDLMLATLPRPSAEERCALCWRAAIAIHGLGPRHSARLTPLEAHRALYLQLDSARELDGARGRVEPIAHGRWRPTASGLAELCWTPHGAPWCVRFDADGRPVDCADPLALAPATRIERLT